MNIETKGVRVTSAKSITGIVHGYIDVQKYLRSPDKANDTADKKEPDSLTKRVSVYILQMKNEFLRDVKIGDICKVFKVHPSFLSRKFKKATKYTLQEFIQRIKIQRTVMLLQQDALCTKTDNKEKSFSLRIDDLADKLGFSSPEYFIRCFKKRLGVSPGTYRKCFRQQTMGLNSWEGFSNLGF